jgi:hypothetical protein
MGAAGIRVSSFFDLRALKNMAAAGSEGGNKYLSFAFKHASYEKDQHLPDTFSHRNPAFRMRESF